MALPADSSSPTCVQGTKASLNLALRMLEEYDAVGILERMRESMQLLEAVLPRWISSLLLFLYPFVMRIVNCH